MPTASFMVCEKSGHWAIEFRRHLEPLNRRVHELRSLEEANDELQSAGASFLALEATRESLQKTWSFLANLSAEHGQARALVLADPEIRPWTWYLRELGAVEVIYSWRQVPRIIPLIARHLAMYPSRDRSLRQQIEDRLLWRDETYPTY